MMINFEQELEFIESQPEWVGINKRVKDLLFQKENLVKKFDEKHSEWLQKSIEKCDEEIKFFENILLFWAANYKKLERFAKSIDHQIQVINKGADLLELIDDLKIAYTYAEKENIILSQTFIKLCEDKNMPIEKMDSFFKQLRITSRDYFNHMKKRLDEQTGE